MNEKNLKALEMFIAGCRSFQLGKRGASWKFNACGGSYYEAYCDRLKCTAVNIDEMTVEDGHLRCYAEGGYVMILDIDLEDYLTVAIPIVRVDQ